VIKELLKKYREIIDETASDLLFSEPEAFDALEAIPKASVHYLMAYNYLRLAEQSLRLAQLELE
jgi:hypothetical protein